MAASLRSRILCALVRTPPVVNTLIDHQARLHPSCDLLARLPVDENLANYRKLPHIVNSDRRGVSFDSWPSTAMQRNLAVIHQASVIGDECIVLPDQSFLLEPIWHISLLSQHAAYRHRFYQRRTRKLTGTFFLVPLFWFDNYYHWNAQVLPRFHEVLARLPCDCHFIVPVSARSWQIQSLHQLGVDARRILSKPARERWIVDRLLYASPCAPSAGHSSRSISWIREQFTKQFRGAFGAVGPTKIYITRGRARRRVLNEDFFLMHLEKLGFVIADPANMAYLDQIKLFANACLICAPHGAGLVNMIWAQPGCHIIEIFSPATIDRGCFWDLSQNLGHTYSCLLGSFADGSIADTILTDGDSDYLVDPDDLIDCIAACLS
jgi:capsular polysaccharide biosynthesis protein